MQNQLKDFTAAGKSLVLAVKKSIKKEFSRNGVSASTGNDKQFKGLLKAVQSVISHVEEGGPLFRVDVQRALVAATLAAKNKKRVLGKDRKLFVENVCSLIDTYRVDIQKSSKDPLHAEKVTIETIEDLCISFIRRGLVSDTALKHFEASLSGQAVTA